MGANKTDNAIDRSSRASGGEDNIGENFDVQVQRETIPPLIATEHQLQMKT